VGVEKRVERHNLGWSRSTKSGIPWKVVYTKSFEVKTDALKWESHIKRQKSRNFIEALIESVENEHKRE
jgi:putative endonuclease